MCRRLGVADAGTAASAAVSNDPPSRIARSLDLMATPPLDVLERTRGQRPTIRRMGDDHVTGGGGRIACARSHADPPNPRSTDRSNRRSHRARIEVRPFPPPTPP